MSFTSLKKIAAFAAFAVGALTMGCNSGTPSSAARVTDVPENRGSVSMPLQTTDEETDTLIGVDLDVDVYLDPGEGGEAADCNNATVLIAEDVTDHLDEEFFLALEGDDYCVDVTSWTLWWLDTDGDPDTWVEVPEGDATLTTPMMVPVTVTNTENTPLDLDWDWVGNPLSFGYGTVEFVADVEVTACAGECGNDPDDEFICAVVNETPAACYPRCTMNADCEGVCEGGSDGLCARGVDITAPVCVCN